MPLSPYTVTSNFGDSTLLFNTQTLAFASLDLPLHILESTINDAQPTSDGIVQRLIKYGFIYSDTDDVADVAYDDFLYDFRKSRYGPQPLVVYISPTLSCNATCSYCFQREIRRPTHSSPEPNMSALAEFIARELVDANSLKVTWFGGEPLLRPQFIENATSNLRRVCEQLGKPFRATMVSNGLLLSRDQAALLDSCGVENLQISLDGPEDIHNWIGRRDAKRGFRTIIDNILELPRSIRVGLRVNVSKDNLLHITTLIDQLRDAGINELSGIRLDFPLVYDFVSKFEGASYDTGTSYSLPSAKFAYLQLQFLAYAEAQGFVVDPEDILISGSPQCHAIREKGFAVWPNGNITRCIHDVTTPEGIQLSSTMDEVRSANSLRQYSASEVFSSAPCKTCFYLPMCGGSCLHSRLNGVHPPFSCPPSKYTMPDRMRWYEALQRGEPCPIEHMKEDIIRRAEELLSELQ